MAELGSMVIMHSRTAGSRVVSSWLWDIAMGLAIVGGVSATASDYGSERAPLLWVIELLPAPLMLLRRHLPWLVLSVGLVTYAAVATLGELSPVTGLPVAFAVYTIAVTRSRPVTIWTAALTTATLEAITIPAVGAIKDPTTFGVLQTMALATAIGLAVASRRAYMRALTERAESAERSRDAEASRRVVEDRLRIARDLHDTVAHQIAVISLNAGVATATLDTKPDDAREALAAIRAASRHVLSEIGALLSSLRLSDDAATTAPIPQLDQIATLVGSFEQTGMSIDLRVHGDVTAVGGGLGAVAYRVVQEALTNAHKHGLGDEASVTITITSASLRIHVENRAAPSRADVPMRAGHGLAGIRERVASVSGVVQVQLWADKFTLDAELPREKEGAMQ